MAEERELEVKKSPVETISRRTFLQGVAASAATVALADSTGSTAAALGTSATSSAFKTLTAAQSRVLTVVLNHLIPPDGKMPGAGDIGLAGFVDKVLDKAPHLRQPVMGLLAPLADCEGDVSHTDLDELLHRFEHEQKESFRILLQVAYTGYYSNPLILEALGADSDEISELRLERFDDNELQTVSAHFPTIGT